MQIQQASTQFQDTALSTKKTWYTKMKEEIAEIKLEFFKKFKYPENL